jgi:cytochrome P450
MPSQSYNQPFGILLSPSHYPPPGTDVALCAWNILRLNKKAYGDDAAAYRPECWLEASPERLAVMEEAFHLVFGFGRVRCIGENSQTVSN